MFRILFSAMLSVSKSTWFPEYRGVGRYRRPFSCLYILMILQMAHRPSYLLRIFHIFRKRIYRLGEIAISPSLTKHLTRDGPYFRMFGSDATTVGWFYGCCMGRFSSSCFDGVGKYLKWTKSIRNIRYLP